MNIIAGEKMYDTSSEASVYGQTQMNWDENLRSDNFTSYLPEGIKKEVFVGFDVPTSIMENGVLYIRGNYFGGKLQELKIPLKNLR